jgi:hypothetical protein
LNEYHYKTDIKGQDILLPYMIWLQFNGELSIWTGYAWDGPSGPGIDTRNFMRGSLVHDALYQLIRKGLLPEKYRENADRIIRDICLEDGMSKIRAWWVYHGLRLFGKSAATGPDEKEGEPITT